MRYWLICAVVLIGAILLLGSLGVSDSPPDAVTRWWELIEPAADQYKVDPVLIAAIMMQESGGNPNAQSRAGANGLMQVLGGPFDPQPNVALGVHILAGHLQTFKDLRPALAAYNAGPGLLDEEVSRNPAYRYAGVRGAARRANAPIARYDAYAGFLPAETQRYVPAVLAYYERFKRYLPR